MNLLVNISPLSEPLSGIGRYTKELIGCLLGDPELDDVVGFNDFGYTRQRELVSLIDGLDTRPKAASARNKAASQALYNAVKPFARKVPYARVIRDRIKRRRLHGSWENYRHYVYWEPNYILQACNEVSVATIHDLSYLRYPDFHPLERVRWLEAGLGQTIARATRLVTVSEFSKSEIVNAFPVAPEKIDIVRPGVSEKFFARCGEDHLRVVRERYKLPQNYVLSVGTLEPRKNVQGLIAAYQGLPAAVRGSCPLVLVGARGWQNSTVENCTRRAVARGEVIRLGYVHDADLPALYQAATLFAYPSFYEGFGMPVLEALAGGTPVITSNCSSMPEVANGHAALVDPGDSVALTESLARMIERGAGREDMEDAIAYARGCTWDVSAKILGRLFREMDGH